MTLRLMLFTLAVLGSCISVSGCLTGCGPEAREVKAIMNMRPQERQAAFAGMAPEKQLKIYFYGQHYEPPYDFQAYLAPNWKSLLPLVKQRLVLETDEKKVADMLALLEIISLTQCSLTNRPDVLDVASRAAAQLRIPTYVGRARQALLTIMHTNRPLPPCE